MKPAPEPRHHTPTAAEMALGVPNLIGCIIAPNYGGKSSTLRHLTAEFAVHPIEMSESLLMSSVAAECKPFMERGEMVPLELNRVALRESAERDLREFGPGRKYLLSGYPRVPEQADIVSALQLPVFYIDTSIITCVERAFIRLEELQQAATTGGATAPTSDREGRVDESADPVKFVQTLERRLGIFCVQTLRAVRICENAGILRRIDPGAEPAERARQIAEHLQLQPVVQPPAA